MYAIDEVTADADVFREAVAAHTAYRPLYVKIKLMFGCNLKCVMCNHWRATREPPLAMDRFYEVLTELADLGCRKIHLSGGEPLLRPQVPELVAHATSLGLRVTMTTNGTLIDKTMARRLVEAGLRGVNVSLDSPERRVHDRVRGVRGAWKQTTRAIEHFARARPKGKLTLRVNTVISHDTYRSLASLPDLAHNLGADALNLIAVDDHCGEHVALSRRHIVEYNQQVAPILAERALALGLLEHAQQAYPFGQTDAEIQQARRGNYAFGWYDRHPCFAPWTHSLIDFNGLVYVCCMTREQITPLGDLRMTSFADIWHGSAYQVIRQQMHPPALAPCRRCDDFLGENRALLALVD